MDDQQIKQNNKPVRLEIRDDYVWITLHDSRIIAAPLNWYDWLETATPKQQQNFKLGWFSILWPDLEDGIDLEPLLVGSTVSS